MRRVIKIGGSLLLRESLAESLDRWVGHQPESHDTIAIVGGGALIDAVRGLDDRYAMPSDKVHWECVELLGVTYRWLGSQLSDWQLCQTPDEFERLRSKAESRTPVRTLVAVSSFYRPEFDCPLPQDWSTTTDAIAGWLSILVGADELVLLKSCDADPAASLDGLATEGIVDRAMPHLSDRLPPVRLVNFVMESDIDERSI